MEQKIGSGIFLERYKQKYIYRERKGLFGNRNQWSHRLQTDIFALISEVWPKLHIILSMNNCFQQNHAVDLPDTFTQ